MRIIEIKTDRGGIPEIGLVESESVYVEVEVHGQRWWIAISERTYENGENYVGISYGRENKVYYSEEIFVLKKKKGEKGNG